MSCSALMRVTFLAGRARTPVYRLSKAGHHVRVADRGSPGDAMEIGRHVFDLTAHRLMNCEMTAVPMPVRTGAQAALIKLCSGDWGGEVSRSCHSNLWCDGRSANCRSPYSIGSCAMFRSAA